MNPKEYIADLESYAISHGFRLTADARKLVLTWEEFGARVNRIPMYYVVLPALVEQLAPLRSLMIRRNADPDNASKVLRGDVQKHDGDDPYDSDTYSDVKYRTGCRAPLVDYGIAAARRHGRSEISPLDFLEGYLDAHDETFPPLDNASWRDEALHVPFNTLAHIRGEFSPSLWVSFDDIRRELGLQTADAARKEPVDAAPPHLKPAVLSLLAEHPDYRSNCFLIMPFRETDPHRKIHRNLKAILGEHGFNLLRADDRTFSEDVLANIEAYMYGCKFGIAVHERLLSENQNPNVALEVGYMLGLKKEVCLLKELTVVSLPSDLQGRLYVPFDFQNLERSLHENVSKWLKRRGLIAHYER